jgi:hypothetical protein
MRYESTRSSSKNCGANHLNICSADNSGVSLDATIPSGEVICCERTLCESHGRLAYLGVSAGGAAFFPATLVFEFPVHRRVLETAESTVSAHNAENGRNAATQRTTDAISVIGCRSISSQIALRAADRTGRTISAMAVNPEEALFAGVIALTALTSRTYVSSFSIYPNRYPLGQSELLSLVLLSRPSSPRPHRL